MKKNILMIGVLLSCSFFVAMEQDLSSGKEEEEQVTDQFREAIDRIVSESSTKEEAFERLKSYGERALIGRSDAFLKASLIRLYDKFLWNKDISYTINAARGFKEELALDPEKANRILYGLIHLIVKNSLRDAIEFDLAFSRKIESPLAYQSFITLLRNNVAEEEMEEYFDELFAFASEDVQDREFTDLFTRHAQAAILIMPSLFERGLEVDKDKIILPLHHLVIEGTPPLLRTALQSPLSNSVQLAPSIRPQHLNAKNDEGMTPLHLALFYNPSMAPVLLAYASNRAITNDQGQTAYEYAQNLLARELVAGTSSERARNLGFAMKLLGHNQESGNPAKRRKLN